MHQHAGGAGLLRSCELSLDKVGGVHLHQVGRRLACLNHRRRHSLEPHGVLGPDVSREPQRLRGVGQVDRRDVAAFGAGDLDAAIGRRIALPFRLEPHRPRLRPGLHPGEVVVIPRQHQIDPRARSDLETLETRRQSLVGQPQHRRDEIGRASGLIGLRRAIEPREQFGLVAADCGCDDCGVVNARLIGVDRFELRFCPVEPQRVNSARQPQRQCIGERRARPSAHAIEQFPGLPALQEVAQRRHDPRRNRRASHCAIGHLVVERLDHDLRALGVDIDELVVLCHPCPFPRRRLMRPRYASTADLRRAQGPHP